MLFYCLRGKHRSAAAVAGYIARCKGLSRPDVVMQQVAEMSAAQRGRNSGARFHEDGGRSDFPALAPLVRALAALRSGPRLPDC